MKKIIFRVYLKHNDEIYKVLECETLEEAQQKVKKELYANSYKIVKRTIKDEVLEEKLNWL